MTKPSEDFLTEWSNVHTPLTAKYAKTESCLMTAWHFYLKGRDERPVVVPVLITDGYKIHDYWRCICEYMLMFPHDPSLTNYKSNYCPDCGAPLDWSKADD